MATELQSSQRAQLQQVADVKAVGSGIEPRIDREASGIEPLEQRLVGDLVHQAARFEILGGGRHPSSLPERAARPDRRTVAFEGGRRGEPDRASTSPSIEGTVVERRARSGAI